MKTNILFKRVPAWTYVLLLGVLTNGTPANGFFPGGGGATANSWTIENPAPSESFSKGTAQIGASGNAEQGGASFTIKIKRQNGNKDVFSSASGTSTTTTGGNYQWAATLPPPTGGFPVGTHSLILSPTGGNGPNDQNIIFY